MLLSILDSLHFILFIPLNTVKVVFYAAFLVIPILKIHILIIININKYKIHISSLQRDSIL